MADWGMKARVGAITSVAVSVRRVSNTKICDCQCKKYTKLIRVKQLLENVFYRIVSLQYNTGSTIQYNTICFILPIFPYR